MVGGNGTVQGTVPNTVDGDDVRVVAAADSEDGEPIVIAYGVQVDEDSSSQSPWSVVLLIVVGLAIVGGFAVPAVRRRQQVS